MATLRVMLDTNVLLSGIAYPARQTHPAASSPLSVGTAGEAGVAGARDGCAQAGVIRAQDKARAPSAAHPTVRAGIQACW